MARMEAMTPRKAAGRMDLEIALRERIKELNCLYSISRLREEHYDNLEGFLQGVVGILPGSWQFPEQCCARIRHGRREYVTPGFRVTRWRQTADVVMNAETVGSVEVYYLKKMPDFDVGPFLKEEEALISAVAKWIGHVLVNVEAQRELQAAHKALQVERQALQAVLARIEEEKQEIKKSILANVQKVILPIVYNLEMEVPRQQRPYVAMLRGNLEKITSPFVNELARAFTRLTPVEIRIASMIRDGNSTKEIAHLRSISPATVRRHRDNMRRKLGLANKKVNLATYLQGLGAEEPPPLPIPGLGGPA